MNTSATATSNHSSTPEAGRTWGRWLYAKRVPSVVFGGIILVLLGFIYFQTTLVSGRELNVRTWEVRQFSFRRDPFTNFQFSGVRHKAPAEVNGWVATGEFVPLQVASSIRIHLTRSNQMKDRWDLIDFGIDGSNSKGDALILVKLLSAMDPEYLEFWPTWSTDNSKKAAILWPAAQDLVRCKLYSKLPELLESALSNDTDPLFEEQINQFMADALLEQSQFLLTRQNRNSAVEVARIGLTYDDVADLSEIVNSSP